MTVRKENLMGILSTVLGSGLTAGESHGGSVNSSFNASNNFSDSASQSYASTDGTQAQQWAAEQARIAFERQKQLMQMEMEFNRQEAQKARDWNENMANTVYTRSVNNMKEAGINPVLAAQMGLSAASVGSGQTASIGGASAPLAQTFANSSSASNSWSHSEGSSKGGSSGSSWNDSVYGLSTALDQLTDAGAEMIDSASSALHNNPDILQGVVNGVLALLPGVAVDMAPDAVVNSITNKAKK